MKVVNNAPVKYNRFFAILLILLSCSYYNEKPYVTYLIQYAIWGFMIFDLKLNKRLFFSLDYIWCALFLLWTTINSIRGAIVADNYWEYKQLASGILMCSLPLIAYYMRDPYRDAYILNCWNKWMLIIYLFFFIWILPLRYEFWLLPFIVLYLAYFNILPLKWKIIVSIFFFMAFLDLTARSFIVKLALSLLATLGLYFKFLISNKLFRVLHGFIYFVGFLLLIQGLYGNFNILNILSQEGEKEGIKQEEVIDDTRSFIYEEVLTDAIQNKYMVYGRTPARGNYSPFFYNRGADNDLDNLNGKMERHANELVHLNILTWLGLIGVFLYSMIYFWASYLSVYKSNSCYMKMMGLMIAFHWVYGWIEDANTFTIQNFWLWLMIAMGLSRNFRNMTDKEYVAWFKSIFHSHNINRVENS